MRDGAPTNKFGIVTGASSGVGLGITRALLERGYEVVANSRTISQSKGLRAPTNFVLWDGYTGNKHTVAITSPIALFSPAWACINGKPTKDRDRD